MPIVRIPEEMEKEGKLITALEKAAKLAIDFELDRNDFITWSRDSYDIVRKRNAKTL